MKSLFLVLILFSSLTYADRGEAAKARFEVWLRVLEKTLASSRNPAEVAEALLSDDNRIAAFNLQALGKIYTPQKNTFSKLVRQSFKDLEDGIGEYDKWKKISKKSGSSRDQAKAEEAKKSFAQMLVKENWLPLNSNSRTRQVREFLSDFAWESYSDDKEQVLKVLVDQLEKLQATRYDVSRLEKRDGDGNGLHELRREIRWLMIEARVLNGLVQFKADPSCSVPELEPLLRSEVAKSRYATLPASALEKEPCFIEQCLFVGLAQNVNQLGAVKDAAEQNQQSRESDTVLGQNLRAAQDIYKQIQRTDVFNKLSQNINACLK